MEQASIGLLTAISTLILALAGYLGKKQYDKRKGNYNNDTTPYVRLTAEEAERQSRIDDNVRELIALEKKENEETQKSIREVVKIIGEGHSNTQKSIKELGKELGEFIKSEQLQEAKAAGIKEGIELGKKQRNG